MEAMSTSSVFDASNLPSSRLRHDLLTPINHIIGYSEMMMEELEEHANAVLTDRARSINELAKEALGFIHAALPAGQEASPEALPLLGEQLLRPMQSVVRITNSIGDDAPAKLREVLGADLIRIASAANTLCSMLNLSAPEPTIAEPVAVEPAPADAEPLLPAVGRILMVDDNAANRDLLGRRLQREGYHVSQATTGPQALEMLATDEFDLVLLDVVMPEMSGFEVLQRMKGGSILCNIPVIMISAMDEVQNAVRCIEMGAEDYLTKPFDPVLLRARIGACLEKKRLRDEERRASEQLRTALREVEEQRRISESLLLNILPPRISEELRTHGHVTPKYYDDVTIVFTDFVDFTLTTEGLAADELVALLHDYFTRFDRIVKRYGLEKLKTIGDSYMFIGGLPPRQPSHPVDAILACFEIIETAQQMRANMPEAWGIRVGVHTGPVIAGVVGIEKFAFDVWGETVNYSSRMESCGQAGRINMSQGTYSRIKDFFACEPRGKILTKEQKAMEMYFAKGVHPKLMQDLSSVPPPLFVKRYRTYFERDPAHFPAVLCTPPEGTSAT